MNKLSLGRVFYGVFLRVVLLFLTAAVARQSLHAETPEMQWQEVYPYPTASWLNAAAWGPPGFVAVGSGGEILVSEDGLQWQKSTNSVQKGVWFSDVCFYNGRYVALGDSGALLWSTNGLNWQQVSTGTNTWLRACAGGGGLYVIAAGNNTLLVSSNAVDWQPCATPDDFVDIVYGSNQWVAVDGGSGIYLSTDLLNWTNTNPSFIPYSGPCFGTVCFGEGKFVAGGAWQPDQPNGVLYGSVIYYSSNGVSWTTASLSGLDAFGEVKSAVFAAGQFVAVQAGYFLRSTNGENWEKIATPDAGGALRGITSSSAGRFLAVGEKGAMLRSDDGQTWTVISVNPRDEIQGMAYADGRFVAVGGSPYNIGGPVGSAVLLTSTNGYDWQASLTNLENQLSAVAYGNGLWVVTGDNGGIFTSSNGVDWADHSLPPTSHDLNQVAYGNGRFVALAIFNDLVYYSTNGLDWVSATAPLASEIAKVRFCNGRFIGVGGDYNDGFIFSSADGVNWDKTTLVGTSWLEGVTFGKGRYVAAGRSVSAISFDGTNWSVYPVPVIVNDLQYMDGWFIGGMVVSRDGVRWEMADNPGALVYEGGVIVASGGMSLYRGTLNDSEDFNKRLRLLSPAQLEFYGESGHEYRLELSPDLLNWAPVSSWTTGSNDCLVWDRGPFLSPAAFWRAAGRSK